MSRQYPELRAVWCQRYCEFLVDTGRAAEAYARAKRALIDPEKPKGWGEGAFAAPVVTLALVRAATRLFEVGTPTVAIDKMLQMIDDAEGQCAGSDEPPPASKAGAKLPEEKGGKMTWLRPVFRIARARLLRHLRRYAEASAELDCAEKDCGEMGTELYIPDIDLERARIFAVHEEFDAARRALEHARSGAGAMGLKCRDAEFAELSQAVDGNPDLAEQHRNGRARVAIAGGWTNGSS